MLKISPKNDSPSLENKSRRVTRCDAFIDLARKHLAREAPDSTNEPKGCSNLYFALVKMDCTQKQEKLSFSGPNPSVSSEGFFDFKLNQNVEGIIVCDAPCDSVMNANESFLCHRSRNFVSDSKGLRHLKILGSNKINAYCPAALKVTQHTDGKYVESYQKIHIGHQNDIGYLFLTADEREITASKRAAKIPLDNILDEIGNSISDAGLERVHLLTKKDLHNIEKSFNLSSNSLKHDNDGVSVDMWVREMKNSENPCILFIKPRDHVCNIHF
ncbi:MULE domain-containing protein [Trichonephila clavipes]|nr:MULE domain-containing protein [Trichonephila clavipes]